MNVYVIQLLYHRTAIKNFKNNRKLPPDVFIIHNVSVKIP